MDFEKYDLENGIRKKFVSVLENEFKDFGLKFSIGGQISFDVFPIGWQLDGIKHIVFNF